MFFFFRSFMTSTVISSLHLPHKRLSAHPLIKKSSKVSVSVEDASFPPHYHLYNHSLFISSLDCVPEMVFSTLSKLPRAAALMSVILRSRKRCHILMFLCPVLHETRQAAKIWVSVLNLKSYTRLFGSSLIMLGKAHTCSWQCIYILYKGASTKGCSFANMADGHDQPVLNFKVLTDL